VKRKSKLAKLTLPTVTKRTSKDDTGLVAEFANFPVPHYSYSSFTKFGSDPFMFKVNYINGDQIETTSSPSNVLGKAMHKALETYLGGNPDVPVPQDDGEAIKIAHQVGLDYLLGYSDGFIGYNTVIASREKLNEKFAFAFFGYIKEFDYRKYVKEVVLVEKMLKHKIEVDGKVLPIPLKGSADLVYRDHKDRLIIRDHKITSTYSNPEAIDGAKLIQAAFNYFLVAAETGEVPYSMVYAEFKISKNADNSPQMREFEIVFDDHPLIFEFFYRYYYDVTDALLGKQVFVPNVYAMYDKEVSILAYIHRLDQDEEREKAFKKNKVDNITDFLKKRIQKDGAMKQYLETVSAKFVSAETLNYKNMTTEEKIKMKLAEHGLAVEFHSKVRGNSVELYRYEPSIGLKMSKIASYTKDIEQVVEKSGIRVLAPIRDSGLVGFEIPLDERTFPTAPKARGFEIAIGQTVMGDARRFDIRQAPHMLVAGSSGSGKSVFLNNLINQLLTIPRVELHLFDPKQVELVQFEGEGKVKEYQSHHAAIAISLEALCEEMEERYKEMKAARAKNIEDMPNMRYKFVIIDEFADLGMKTHIGSLIQVLAQKGRACGIHLIIATQRASTRVINGDIKVNFPTRVVLRMSKGVDSRVMLDEDGAEKLLGKGDMLFASDAGIERLQGYSA